MIKTNKLKAKIVEMGFNLTSFAEELGMDYSTFYRRMTGQMSFTVSDVEKITRVLYLTNSEIIEIFFSKEIA
ncbi:helix-turn-helix domain-containing protein [Peptostreptococcus canis]|uniref:Helix-turn-helix transcriptional regulator n=1 Tax=Peptostreptococcus canis TaxID=1159213 RepID=A0ABR6TN15_9FIRM|nr:helix-turn-helix transcriptional regulator [Peptostreptococcus canis]MBC2576549.1 helix-turn-helix transcriptional regulator [Peptostreptococcus canis]MBP1998735.1 putative transcriptional regulator [Peptostreptococcus canis]